VGSVDAMLGGGLPTGTTTLVLGATGTGKTLLGAHSLAGSSAAEPGLHFGFYEQPERLLQNAASVGLDLAGPVCRGDLELLWYPTTGQILDDLGGQLLRAVGRRGVKRLLVDGLGGYVEAAEHSARAGKVFAALVHELRAQGVTTIYTAETPNLVGAEVVVPVPGVSVVVDNMALLRFAEYRARLHRLFSIIKVRGSAFDPGMREFRITDKGITLADTLPGPGSFERLLYREI
jgi:circadian clock protein KaiC